jgi:hypothetical protein
MSARLPTLRLRRAFTVRWLETMAAVQVPSAQTEWLPMLRLASERAQQSRPLIPEDISQHLLPLSVAAARTWLEQAVHCGMLTATGSPELPTYALSALGAAAAQLGVSTEAQQGLFRFAVADEPLLAGHHVLHLEERREASAGETIPLEELLATEPGACGRSLLQPNTPFVVVRTADVVRVLPTPQELIIELELAPDHTGPFRLRVFSERKEGKGEKAATAVDVRLVSSLQRRADQTYGDLLALVLSAGAAPRELSAGLSVPFAALSTEARLSFRLRHQQSFPAHLRVPGQFDLGVFEVEPIEVALVPRAEDVDAWGLWLQVRALGGERTPAAAAKAGEAARQKIPAYRPRSLHELAAALAQQPSNGPTDGSRAALLEAYDLLLWEDAP